MRKNSKDFLTGDEFRAKRDVREITRRAMYKRGDFGADTCALCGRSTKIVAHHWNGYDHPLDIWWICNQCNAGLIGETWHNGSKSLTECRLYLIEKAESQIVTISNRSFHRSPATAEREAKYLERTKVKLAGLKAMQAIERSQQQQQNKEESTA